MKTKFQLSILILLFFTFTSQLSSAREYFPSLDIPPPERRALGRFTDVLESQKEPPLWSSHNANRESFRFIHNRALGGGPSIFRLDHNKRGWELTWKLVRAETKKTIETTKKKMISSAQMEEFRKLFDALEFWNLPSNPPLETIMIFDGSTWAFEAVENQKYNLVWRRAPESDNWQDREFLQKAKAVDQKQLDEYPKVDRDTHLESTKRLMAVCKFLVELSGIDLKSRDW